MGDRIDITIDELLEHAEWIRRLALALVDDVSAASDLTQETFEVALTRPPKKPGPLRPWLGGVLRNLARKRRRSATRRRQYEQKAELVSRESLPTPEQLVERASVQQVVARCVLELGEPFRSTILLRYYEGMSAAEIARQQRIPAATVRSRLKTGRERVRAALNQRYRMNERKQWSALLSPLAGTQGNTASSTTLVKGALAVKTSTKFVAAAIIILIVGYVGGRKAGWWGTTGSSSAHETVAIPSNGHAASLVSFGQTAPPSPSDVGVALSENDPTGDLRLEGQVVDDEERPVAGATVAISTNPVRTTKTEGDGSFAFEELIGRDYQIEAASGDAYAGPVSLRLGAKTEPVILRLRSVAPIEIQIVDGRDKTPVAGAEVELRSRMVWLGITNDEGVASFSGVGARALTIRVRADGYAAVANRLVSFGQRKQRIVIALRAGAAVSGRVLDTSGKPIVGARVFADSTSEPFPVIDPKRDGVMSNDDGTFRIPALAAGTYRFTAAATSFATASSSPVSIDGRTDHEGVEIALPSGARLKGVVMTTTGAPVVGADVRVVATGAFSWRRARHAFTGSDGVFEVRDLARRDFGLVASHDLGSTEIVKVDFSKRAEANVKLTLTITGAISGRVVDETGEALPEARIRAEPVWSGGLKDRAVWGVRGTLYRVADSEGNFSFRGVPDGRYKLRAIRGGDLDTGLFIHESTVVESGATNVELVVPTPGRVTGRVAYADGEAPNLFAVSVGGADPIPMGGSDGRFELDSPGGSVRIEVSGPSFTPKTQTVDVKGAEVADLGTITVERGRSVFGRVLDPNGIAVADAQVAVGALLSGDGSKLFIESESVGAFSSVTDESGRFLFSGLGPESLTIVAGKSSVGRSPSIALPPGSDSVSLDLSLAPTGKLTGVVRASGKPVGETVLIATPIGETSSNFFVMTGTDGSYAFDALTAGQYVVFPMIAAGGGHRGVMARPKDLYMRPVEVVAGERINADIDFEVGSVELEIEVKTDSGTPVVTAAVFVIGALVDVANAKALRDGGWVSSWQAGDAAKMDPVPLHTRQATGGKASIMTTPGTYSACVALLPGTLDETAEAMTLPDQVEKLPLTCQTVKVGPSPARRPVQVLVPGALVQPRQN